MTAANSRCNGACPCGDVKAKAKPKALLTKGRARLILLGFLALPVGAVATILTGDLRPLGVGLVVIATAIGYGSIITEADKKAGR